MTSRSHHAATASIICALAVSIAASALGCKDTRSKAKKRAPVSISAPAAVRFDPMELTAPDLPPDFRQTLKTEEYDKRFEAALASLPSIADLKNEKSPPFGLTISSIELGSQAQDLHLASNDIITAIDGHEVFSESQLNQLRMNEPQDLEVITPGQNSRTLRIKPGPLGVSMLPRFRPDLAYLRSARSNKRWDDLVRVALTSCWTDPALAEMAMRSAIQRDYPLDWNSYVVGLIVNAQSGRAHEAMQFYSLLKKTAEAADRPLPHDLLYRAAIADFKLPVAIEALQATPRASSEVTAHLKNLLAAYQSLPESQRKTVSLDEQAVNMRHDNQTTRLEPLNEGTAWLLDQVNRNKRVQTAAPGVDSVSWVFAPKEPAQDVDFTLRFSMAVSDNVDPQTKPSFSVGLFDRDHPYPSTIVTGPEVGGLLAVRLGATASTDVDVFHGNGLLLLHAPVEIKLDLKQDITLRLVHLNGRDAIFLNNHQILYLPSANGAEASTRAIGAYIKSTGINARLWSLKFTTLKPERGYLAHSE